MNSSELYQESQVFNYLLFPFYYPFNFYAHIYIRWNKCILRSILIVTMFFIGASQVALVVKNLSAMRPKIPHLDPWVRKIPWRTAWIPTPEFLPGESHGQRSMVGYSP